MSAYMWRHEYAFFWYKCDDMAFSLPFCVCASIFMCVYVHRQTCAIFSCVYIDIGKHACIHFTKARVHRFCRVVYVCLYVCMYWRPFPPMRAVHLCIYVFILIFTYPQNVDELFTKWNKKPQEDFAYQNWSFGAAIIFRNQLWNQPQISQ